MSGLTKAVVSRQNRMLRAKVEKQHSEIEEAKAVLRDAKSEIELLREGLVIAMEDMVLMAQELKLSQERANDFTEGSFENMKARFMERCR